MRSLFWKVFFGAWLTAVAMVVATVYITHFREFGDPRREELWEGQALFREVMRNIRISRRHGTEHIRTWLEQQPARVQNRVFIASTSGEDLLGREIPEDVQQLLDRLSYREREIFSTSVRRGPTIAFFVPEHFFFSAERAARPDDEARAPQRQRKRVIVRGAQPLEPGEHDLRVAIVTGNSKAELLLKFLWQNFWPILLLSMLASGIACYWLARYLSNPLDKLRTATRQVAAGALDYRVAPAIRNRGDELSDLARDFDSMTAQLQESMAEQRRLIKDVSHELRSPLARLQVALGIARQKNVTGLEAELDRIGKAADYLEDIIADVLSLPVAGTEQRPLDDVVELNSLLQALLEDLSDEAKTKQLNFRFEPVNREMLVATRGSSLTAALENILRNAINYSPLGGDIALDLAHSGDTCRIRVIDSGPGVPEVELQAIFRPFYRTDQARTRESGGFGLGLAIAQRTLLGHRGSIAASNAPGAGLCVEITLPLVTAEF